MAEILDGKKVSSFIIEKVRSEVKTLEAKGLPKPCIAVVIVGNDPASRSYVKKKHLACSEVGIQSEEHSLPDNVSQEVLLQKISELNLNPTVHGILVQLPLPKHLSSRLVFEAIVPHKDVDGFHPINVGKLVLGEDAFIPCTPLGVIELLKHYKIPLEGKKALVIGRSNIVGKPLSFLLLKENCTVTIAHSKSENLADEVSNSEILCACVGKPFAVKGSWIRNGAVVVDVGINFIPDSTKTSGTRMVGDVEFDEAVHKASYITPVPGGVGPMTIAILLKNTLKAYNIQTLEKNK